MPFRFMVGDGPLWLQMVKAVLARRPVHFRAGGSKGPAVEFTSYQILNLSRALSWDTACA